MSCPRTESKSRFNNLSVFELMLKLGIDGNLTPLARSSQKQAGHLIKLSTLLRDSSNGPGCSALNWPRCRVNDPSFLKIFFRANCFCPIRLGRMVLRSRYAKELLYRLKIIYSRGREERFEKVEQKRSVRIFRHRKIWCW